ncbi:MAG TPA: hypothetical protein VFU94_13695, partial [Conexibacter sp.]|nr:hypothetical protein [Conexibacter sp.]
MGIRARGTLAAGACVAAVAVTAWRVQSLRPGVGADWSWVATLAYGAEHGLRAGSQVVWSYGPLGFLNTWYGPVLYYPGVLAAAWLFAALTQLLLAGTLLAALRRSLPLPAAAFGAAVALALVPDRVPALGLAWCALALASADRAARGRAAEAFAPALGALTGIALLGKLNQGVELLVLAAVTFAAVPRRRDALAFAGALLASAAAGWFASGQTVSDAWPYVRGGAQVVAGYAAAMGTSDAAHRWAYAAALALAALALALAWDAMRGRPRRRRWGMLALCAAYAFFTFKEGFVREDPPHLGVFFGDMAVLFAVLPLRRSRWLPALAGVAICAASLGAVLGVRQLARELDPVENVVAAADQVRTLASPARRASIAAGLRAQVVATYGLDPALAAAVGRRTVMMWPLLLGEVAWAYGLNLRPLPTLEPYATYTPALDRRAADMLASTRAPERILRALATPLDGRHPSFEAPLAALAIACRYRQLDARPPWQLLARGA